MRKRVPPKKLLKKSLGQYFLVAPHVAEKSVLAAHLLPNDIVLEIGPGGGALTAVLLGKAKKIIAVEKDALFIDDLKKIFAQEIADGRLELIRKDILTLDLGVIGVSDGKYKVVANIPYYITGALIRMLLTATLKPSAIVLLVQKEIAERIAKDKKESVLSLSVKAYGAPRYVETVKGGAFRPQPNVDSAILAIENISRNFFTDVPEDFFFKILKVGFSSKRKYLINNLEKIVDKKILRETFKKIGLGENVRAENVALNVWRDISQELIKTSRKTL